MHLQVVRPKNATALTYCRTQVILIRAPCQITSRDGDLLPVKEGALVPLELKSGFKGRDNLIRHKAQVMVYSLLLADRYGATALRSDHFLSLLTQHPAASHAPHPHSAACVVLMVTWQSERDRWVGRPAAPRRAGLREPQGDGR